MNDKGALTYCVGGDLVKHGDVALRRVRDSQGIKKFGDQTVSSKLAHLVQSK